MKDEVRRARAIYRLLEDLGIDADSHVAKHDYTLRLDLKSDELKDKRAADDRRVNIFYYPIDKLEVFEVSGTLSTHPPAYRAFRFLRGAFSD